MTETNSNYQLVCGLEVHAELKTKSKMFCGCKNDPFHAEKPNIYTCPVCLGMPGALPVANKTAIEWTIKLGLALNCKINLFSKFDRKHYFYPDLPKGYQISQYDLPFCYDGLVETSEGPVRIRRIHLEEDTGKLLHKTVNGEKVSLIDFNRSSVPLVEVVTEADIKSATQAKEYAKKLRQILRYLDIADCDMEQGGMRLEANISLRSTSAPSDELPNYKVEVKNINSFRFMEQAINFEVQRQALELMDGRTPKQETRGWDTTHNTTFPQRSKEDAEDYRYFPDPDLPPIRFTPEHIEAIRASLPAMPDTYIQRWTKDYELKPSDAETLSETQALITFTEALITAAEDQKIKPVKVINQIINKKIKLDVSNLPSEEKQLKKVVLGLLKDSKSLENTYEVSEAELEKVINDIISSNQDAVANYRAGKTQVLGFLIGMVKRQLGNVDVATITLKLKSKL